MLSFGVNSSVAVGQTLLLSVCLFTLGAWPRLRNGQETVRTVSPSFAICLVLLVTVTGGALLLGSTEAIAFYLCLELQSYGLYLLGALYLESERATSSALVYFLVGGLASTLILVGLGLGYASTGSLELGTLAAVQNGSSGSVLLAIGLLVKLSAAPVHSWAPLVYDGIPTIVVMVLASLPKVPLFLALWLLVPDCKVLLLAAALSLVLGGLLGLSESRLKRLLAYSSVNHTGFILGAIVVADSAGLLLYLGQYVLTILWAFGLILAMGYSSSRLRGDLGTLPDLSGVGEYIPALAFSFSFLLFSMGGIPPLVGFFAKATVLMSLLQGGAFFLALLACLTSV